MKVLSSSQLYLLSLSHRAGRRSRRLNSLCSYDQAHLRSLPHLSPLSPHHSPYLTCPLFSLPRQFFIAVHHLSCQKFQAVLLLQLLPRSSSLVCFHTAVPPLCPWLFPRPVSPVCSPCAPGRSHGLSCGVPPVLPGPCLVILALELQPVLPASLICLLPAPFPGPRSGHGPRPCQTHRSFGGLFVFFPSPFGPLFSVDNKTPW
ncbi:uncharacterized protein AKAME5_002433400 [Lates japonicus]|uniref:Uncharacterized protein n=1 Tax=Lates japonicus TaxID=270547 RepID=A0AAD3NKZ7_LATJO|nr:uncharacterized protein AKAME5_002121200 [Lates japonicus]GLD73009.1 uncharacterized protein AKAME5_002433400 [Lates japonicus]